MFNEVWNFQLYSAKTFTLTAGHVFEAIIILLIGIIVSKIINRILSKKIYKFVPAISKHDHVLITKTIYILLIIISLYFAVSMLGIPLTTVKFLAGGIGIGIGLGLQSYITNLWSGLVIMVEKPFKMGDVVEINNQIGRIWDISFRSITIHTEENIDIIIPNSVALNENITNWTKKDNTILSSVYIGIGYNSDIEKASDIMRQAASNVEGVLKKPIPFVLFKEHSEYFLKFELYFAINVTNKLERWEFESKVNYSLNKALRDNDIEIPYPKRDVYISKKIA